MMKRLLLTSFVVWAFIPPARAELTINIYGDNPSGKTLTQVSGEEINAIPREIDEMYKVTAEMDEYITRVEKQIALIKLDITNINQEINEGLKVNPAELEKFASTKVDVAEKEISKGIVYDIDIYDHAKKLATPSWDEFKEKYNI